MWCLKAPNRLALVLCNSLLTVNHRFVNDTKNQVAFTKESRRNHEGITIPRFAPVKTKKLAAVISYNCQL